MQEALRDHHALPRIEVDGVAAIDVDQQLSFDHIEEFVVGGVLMPVILAPYHSQAHHGLVHRAKRLVVPGVRAGIGELLLFNHFERLIINVQASDIWEFGWVSHARTLYLVEWLIVYMDIDVALRALANGRRLQILEWLSRPRRHFPPQVDGDLVRDGVCGLLIARKLRVSQPTASEHLKILAAAGLIRGKRIKQWTFYKRDEASIKRVKRALGRI